MDAIEALKTRRSMRAYNQKPVDPAALEEIVDCARLAPSGMNLQPCEFIVVDEREHREDLAASSEFGGFIAEAPVCVAVVAKETGHYLQDAACAATCLMLAARAHELGSCWVHVHDKSGEADVAEMLAVPAGYRVICLIAIGHGEFPPPPPKRALGEVVHFERFGGKAP